MLLVATIVSVRFGIVANQNSREAAISAANALAEKQKSDAAERAALAAKARSDYFVTGSKVDRESRSRCHCRAGENTHRVSRIRMELGPQALRGL